MEILSYIAQTKLDFASNLLTSSRAFVLLVSVLQLSSSKVSLALCWASSASHLLSSLVPAFPFAFCLFSGVFGARFCRLKYGGFHKIKKVVKNVILKKSQVLGKREKAYIYH